MKVILKKDIEKLGKAGEVVSVKDGYARNFLLLKGLALTASAVNLKIVEQEKKKAALRQEKQRQQAEELAQKHNIQVYTGNGKGKTTSSLGLAMRALGHGQKVFMIQFMKGSSRYGEREGVQHHPG